MKSILILAVVMAAVLMQPLQLRADELKVGVVLGLTGYASLWADYSRKGLELATSEVNEVGAVPKIVKLFFEDSRSTSAGAVAAFQKLVDQDKVDVVVGDVWAFLTISMIPLASRHQVVLISPTVMDKSVLGA